MLADQHKQEWSHKKEMNIANVSMFARVKRKSAIKQIDPGADLGLPVITNVSEHIQKRGSAPNHPPKPPLGLGRTTWQKGV